MWETNYSARWLAVTISGDHKEIIYKNAVWDPVHTSPERVENGAKKSQFAVAFTRYRIEIVWKRHPNRRDLKTIPKWCEMKTEPLAVSCEHKIRYFFAPL